MFTVATSTSVSLFAFHFFLNCFLLVECQANSIAVWYFISERVREDGLLLAQAFTQFASLIIKETRGDLWHSQQY